ncbi:hypothetical protein K0M31_015895 [Melipona bicolor]|uniref:Uncharacterized protein n=1 Tax=Melipona bicolor TaxID=60889 RepID=A0AA40G5Y4_9HYME|nr:hypothetical protein K0M31_015895 [Melipona bicolor]
MKVIVNKEEAGHVKPVKTDTPGHANWTKFLHAMSATPPCNQADPNEDASATKPVFDTRERSHVSGLYGVAEPVFTGYRGQLLDPFLLRP